MQPLPFAYGPSLILVALLGRYETLVLETGGGGLLTLGALSIWQIRPALQSQFRLILFWVLAALLYYLAGAWPLIAFALAGGFIEVTRGGVGRGILCWLVVVWLPVGWLLFPETDWNALFDRWGRGWALGLTIAFWVLLAAGLPITSVWVGTQRTVPSAKASGRLASRYRHRTQPKAEPVWMASACFTVAAIVLIMSFDSRQRALIQVEQAADQQRWDTVLSRAATLAIYPPSTRLRIHHALGQTGRLCDELFAYPLQRGTELLSTPRDGLEICLPLSDLLLHLGHVNLAERYAHEALEIQGERPAILRRLARINVLKDRPRAARVFLNHLANIPGQRRGANDQLRALAVDPQLSEDEHLARLRAVQVKVSRSEVQFPTRVVLELANPAGSSNRMAFEFLVADYLLTGQDQEILRSLSRFRELGYTMLPRHVEEAVIALAGGKSVEVCERSGFKLRPGAGARFVRYVEAARQVNTAEAMADEFGDTYWFYRQFGRTRATSL
jgi:hypothetical protein